MRFVRNASDSILRIEHSETHKLYETTLYDRDYAEYAALGGVEFVSNLIVDGFGVTKTGTKAGTKAGDVELDILVSKESIQLSLVYSHPFITKPMEISVVLPCIRRSSAAEDVSVLSRRIRELETLVTSLSAERLALLEDRTSGMVMIPGGGPPCPADVQSVQILASNSPYGQMGYGAYINRYSNKEYLHMYLAYNVGLTSLKGFRYLTKCTILQISGTNASLVDFSEIGYMRELKELIITTDTNYFLTPDNACNLRPALTDISWITHLKKLTSVTFDGCSVLSDITPLRTLPLLRQLTIKNNQVPINTDFLSVAKPKCVITLR